MSILRSSYADDTLIDPQSIDLENSSSLVNFIQYYDFDHHEEKSVTQVLIKFLQQETSLVWIIFGTIGNILSLFVLLRRKMRIHSTFTYLTILAICDTLVLYFGLLRDFLVNKYNLDINGDILCKFHVFSFYFVLHMASWLLVAVNIDRLIAASFLSLSKTWCTPRTAIKVSIYLAIFLLIINSHFLYFVDSKDYAPDPLRKPRNPSTRSKFSKNNSSILELKYRASSYLWLTDPDQFSDLKTHDAKSQISLAKYAGNRTDEPVNPYVYRKCLIKPNSPVYSYFFSKIFTWIDASAQVILPFIIMLICNINIIHKVLLTKNKSNGKNLKRVRKIRGMCIMIVSVSVIFFVLEAPILLFICLIQGSYIQPTWPYIELFWTIMNLMMYTNHVINFISYCMTGTKFRRELLRLFCIDAFLKQMDDYKNMFITQNGELKKCDAKSPREKKTVVKFFKRNQELNFVTESAVKNKNNAVKPVNLTAGILNRKRYIGESATLKKNVDKDSDSELSHFVCNRNNLEKNVIDSIRADNQIVNDEEIPTTKSFSRFSFQGLSKFRRKSKKSDSERIQLDEFDIEMDEESGYF
ncbi:FMRFamide receptor-like [Brachionus plicatilis]|uniref:FMRFamide receptor-like n=1 Tax=Brachionus plicatilis TaxID=10195 RepID=A0A3M7QY12_BRAPC|nr:FMRFamide receptor-like [Brachionus plicatilis]